MLIMYKGIAPGRNSFDLHSESEALHAALVLVNKRSAVGSGILGRREEHALIALRLFLFAYAARLFHGQHKDKDKHRVSCMFCDKLTLGLEALAEAAGEATGAAAKAIYIRKTISCCNPAGRLGAIDIQKVAGLASMVLCSCSAMDLCIGDWVLEKLALNHASVNFLTMAMILRIVTPVSLVHF